MSTSSRAAKSPARMRPEDTAAATPLPPTRLLTTELVVIADVLRLNTKKKASSAELITQITESSTSKAGGASAVCLAMVREAFNRIDKNGDGTLSRIEVVQALRSSEEVRMLLHLPQKIRQEDGTRDLFERVFQKMDADESKSITLPEFEAYFLPALQRKKGILLGSRLVMVLAIAACGAAYIWMLLDPAIKINAEPPTPTTPHPVPDPVSIEELLYD